jgi:hypothetical protein
VEAIADISKQKTAAELKRSGERRSSRERSVLRYLQDYMLAVHLSGVGLAA